MKALWNHQSNLKNDFLTNVYTTVSTETAQFKKCLIEYVKSLPWETLENEELKRQFLKMSDIGMAALPPRVIIILNRLMFANSLHNLKIYKTSK